MIEAAEVEAQPTEDFSIAEDKEKTAPIQEQSQQDVEPEEEKILEGSASECSEIDIKNEEALIKASQKESPDKRPMNARLS